MKINGFAYKFKKFHSIACYDVNTINVIINLKNVNKLLLKCIGMIDDLAFHGEI